MMNAKAAHDKDVRTVDLQVNVHYQGTDKKPGHDQRDPLPREEAESHPCVLDITKIKQGFHRRIRQNAVKS